MPIRITDLISRVPADVEVRVRRTRDQTRSALQDALRAECRLQLRGASDAEENTAGAQVPVDVSPGHPAVLNDVNFPDDFEHMLLLGRYRHALEQARDGVAGLIKLREELLTHSAPNSWVQADEA